MAAIDAAVEEASVDLPEELALARASERLDRLERQLAQRGMDPAGYFQMQGKTREEVLEESKPDAEQELKREAVMAAIAEAEQIEVSEEEMVEALAHTAEHERTSPEKLLERLRENGRDEMVREDIRVRKAIDLVAEQAKPIPLDQAEAREQIWTPEKERRAAGGLWTPDILVGPCAGTSACTVKNGTRRSPILVGHEVADPILAERPRASLALAAVLFPTIFVLRMIAPRRATASPFSTSSRWSSSRSRSGGPRGSPRPRSPSPSRPSGS